MVKKNEKKIKFQKTLTGIEGLDEITDGGLPKSRTTLIVGGAGCGKTIMGMEFLVRGARELKEPGVFMAFEENSDELTMNITSLNYNLDTLIAKKQIYLEHVDIGNKEVIETGDFNLEGLFVRLEHAIDIVGAKRVVLDSLDALFYSIKYEVLRRELKRLFNWLNTKGVTTIITAEAGEYLLTRHGLEEYVADCVMVLDKRVISQISTRRLQIIKYRGSAHGNNEYPFTITEKGITVFPIIADIKEAKISSERISSGIPALDEMLGGKGFFQGSSILVSGSAGTGKSSLALSIVNESCKKKMRCLYCAFEENPEQIIRNME
ncbi:MAG: circadian clock protein KaiC, partial [Bacteroidetes bacterium]|nr:circadian clock protein KaiC [Bacteroidota bacterium]